MKIKMLCENCGSDQVYRDAWAEWFEEEQKWVLGVTFDDAHCNECDGPTHITEVLSHE